MGFLEIAALALRSLQLVGNNPALGGGSLLNLGQYSELLGAFAQLFERGDEAIDDLQDFADIVGAMAKEGRNPTPDEWAILRGRSDVAHETIQDAAAAAEAEAKAEEEEEQRLKDEAEAEERRLKEEAIKTDLARLSDEDLQFNAAEAGIVLTEGMERAEIEALVLKARLEE